MAEFNWNEFAVGTLTAITSAIGGEAKPAVTAPAAPKPAAPALSQMMPLLLIAGVGIVAFALLRK